MRRENPGVRVFASKRRQTRLEELEIALRDQFRTNPEVFDFLSNAGIDGIWFVDLAHPERTWRSESALAALGYGADDPEFSGDIAEVHPIHPDDEELSSRAIRDLLGRPSKPYDIEVRGQHREGHHLWFRVRAFAVRNAAGRATHVIGISNDITATKRLEKEQLDSQKRHLRERESLEADYEALFNASPDMLISVDASSGLVKICNDTLCEKTGFSREEILGTPVFDRYDPSCHPEAHKAFEQFTQTGHVSNRELILRCKDGSTIPVLLSVRGIRNEAGEITRSMSTWRDISQVKRLESLEELTTQLEASNAELDQFAYAASHDLQEPLRAISAFADRLADQFGASLDEEAKTYLDFILNGSRRMKQLIEDLLGFARARSMPLNTEDTDLGGILAGLEIDFAERIASKKIELVYGELPVVRGDRVALEQILRNLVGNAIKFSRDAHGQVEVRSERRENAWLISVTDNGIGIDEKHFGSIFEPFRRLQSRETYPGTGLGLALVKRLLTRAGGEISVQSEAESGTHFQFTWPDPN